MALSPFFKKYLFIWLHQVCLGALVAQRVKWLPEMQEIRVRSLGHEDPLEKEMATHSSILAWNPMDRGAWRATVYGVTVRYD